MASQRNRAAGLLRQRRSRGTLLRTARPDKITTHRGGLTDRPLPTRECLHSGCSVSMVCTCPLRPVHFLLSKKVVAGSIPAGRSSVNVMGVMYA